MEKYFTRSGTVFASTDHMLRQCPTAHRQQGVAFIRGGRGGGRGGGGGGRGRGGRNGQQLTINLNIADFFRQ